MHAMKLRVQALRVARWCSPAAHVEPCHWSEEHHNNVGVSLREMQATMQVMLGVSLQARWDATLVGLIMTVAPLFQGKRGVILVRTVSLVLLATYSDNMCPSVCVEAVEKLGE